MFGAAPKHPHCLNCARPMRLSRRTSRYGGLSDLFCFNCDPAAARMRSLRAPPRRLRVPPSRSPDQMIMIGLEMARKGGLPRLLLIKQAGSASFFCIDALVPLQAAGLQSNAKPD